LLLPGARKSRKTCNGVKFQLDRTLSSTVLQQQFLNIPTKEDLRKPFFENALIAENDFSNMPKMGLKWD
jgi:hypothetical protein